MGSVHPCRISWAPCTPAGFRGLRTPLPDFVGSVHPWLGTPNGWSLEFILSNNINSKPFAFQKFPKVPFVPKLYRFRQKVSTGACLIHKTKKFVKSRVQGLNLWYQGEFGVQNGYTGQKHEETDNRRPNGHRGSNRHQTKNGLAAGFSARAAPIPPGRLGQIVDLTDKQNFHPFGVKIDPKCIYDVIGQKLSM